MQNLRDKLLKAGLVTEDQAKKAETSAPPARRPAAPQARRDEGPRREEGPRRDEGPRREVSNRRDEGPPRREGRRPEGNRPQGRPSGPPANARPVPKLPPLPGSKAHQRLESKRQVELDRKLREIVYAHQVPVDVGATVFYFMTRKGKLRRLELTEPQAKLLQEGSLAVVERPEPAQIEHSLVPAEVAEQMHALSPKSVRFLNRAQSPIGFMSDEQLKARQAAEAAGEVPEEEDEDESPEQHGGEEPGGEEPGSGSPASEPPAAS